MAVLDNKSPNPPSLDKVRERTDSSLESERTTADESLAADTRASEAKEDEILDRDRGQTDKIQQQDRKSRDKLVDQRTGSGTKNKSATQLDEQSIQLERAAADKALQSERLAADVARKRERRRMRLTAEALIVQERGTTDADLLNERSHSDSENGQRDETRSELLSIVSHDLRNPLASIAMGSEVLQLSLQDPQFDRVVASEVLATIQRNTAMMERLICDLLDVERMASGPLEFKRSQAPIKELFSNCADLFGAVALKKSIHLNFSIPDQGLEANIDCDRIMQVMSNLIGNALKHTPKGGSVDVKARLNGNLIVVSVTDSGSGIPPDSQKKIFDKFSQLGLNTRQGLGLGLYISKWIIEAHGGKISVLSEPGKGSAFEFSIPTSSADAELQALSSSK